MMKMKKIARKRHPFQCGVQIVKEMNAAADIIRVGAVPLNIIQNGLSSLKKFVIGAKFFAKHAVADPFNSVKMAVSGAKGFITCSIFGLINVPKSVLNKFQF